MGMPRNRRETEIRERKIRIGVVASCAILGLLGIIACGYGHAAFSSDLMVSGEASIVAGVGFPDYMQDLTPKICGEIAVGTTTQMIDKRDNKKYWVTKFSDGNCWMTQNIAFTLSTSGTLNPTTTAITSNWRPTANSATSVSASTIDTSSSGVRSYNFDKYIIADPTKNASCGYIKASPADCPTQAVAVGSRKASIDPNFYTNNGNKTYTVTEYDAHYLLGVYYQYNAATAGTGGSLTGRVDAAGSICPKNWTLPTYNAASNGSLAHLKTTEGVANNTLFLPPYYYIRSGYIRPDSNFYFSTFGLNGYIFTKTNNNSTTAYYANPSSGSAATNSRNYAYPTRCLVIGE